MGGSSGGGSGGGGVQTTNTVQRSDPWEGQQPYLTTGFEQAESNVLNRPLSYFPDSTVVPFSPETQTALGLQSGRALGGLGLPGGLATQGVQLQNMGMNQLGATINGDYAQQGNPYLQGVADRAMNTIMPQIDAKFANAGRYGSVGHEEALARGLGDAIAPAAFQNYGQERGLQQQAAMAAPGFAQQDYADIAALQGVGGARESLSQEQLADQVARFNFQQGEPTNRLAQYMNLIQGQYGGQSTNTATTQLPRGAPYNPILGGLGGAVGGGVLGNMLGYPGAGAALGGGLGALGGLF